MIAVLLPVWVNVALFFFTVYALVDVAFRVSPWIFRWAFRFRRKPEPFTGRQPIIERYRDYEPAGTWVRVCLAGCCREQGIVFSETVKYRCSDGKIATTKRLIPDHSEEFKQ